MPSSEVMHKWKSGQLHSGSKTGPLVKGQKQAVAIMLSEKRNEAEHGGKYMHKHQRGGAVDSKLMNKGGSVKKYADGGTVGERKYPGIPNMPPDPARGDTVATGNPAAKLRGIPRYVQHESVSVGGQEYKKGGDVKPRHSGSKKHG